MTDTPTTFRGEFEIDDGYVGGRRPIGFRVHPHDLEDDMTDETLAQFYEECAAERMREMGFTLRRQEEFVAWARAVLAERAGEPK